MDNIVSAHNPCGFCLYRFPRCSHQTLHSPLLVRLAPSSYIVAHSAASVHAANELGISIPDVAPFELALEDGCTPGRRRTGSPTACSAVLSICLLGLATADVDSVDLVSPCFTFDVRMCDRSDRVHLKSFSSVLHSHSY